MRNLQNVLTDQVVLPKSLLKNYNRLELNEIEVLILIQIHLFLQEGNYFPTPNELSSFLSIDERKCTKILRSLIQRNYLVIEQKENKEGRLTEVYNLTPLWQRLYNKETEKTQEENKNDSMNEVFIFKQFEQEFARPLSPFEIELINGWIDTDRFELKLIQAALREAVLLGKLNLKYIDRILREWQKKGIQTVSDAKKSSRNFHRNQKSQNERNQNKRDTSFYYNWLEGED